MQYTYHPCKNNLTIAKYPFVYQKYPKKSNNYRLQKLNQSNERINEKKKKKKEKNPITLYKSTNKRDRV